MLSRICLIIGLLLFSLSSHAQPTASMKPEPPVNIEPEGLRIREPFTALGIAHLKIKNNTDTDLKLVKITTDQARHVDLYKSEVNDFGAIQLKRAKNVHIKAGEVTQFSDNDNIKIMLTGLQQKYLPGHEIILSIEFEGYEPVKTYLPVFPSYK